MSSMTELLGAPERSIESCFDPSRRRHVARQALITIFLGGVVFGAVVGAERGGGQVLIAALKIPAVTLLCLAVSGPALHAIAKTFGRGWRFPESLCLLLCAGARSSLVLCAFAPVLWLAGDLGAGYHAARLSAAAAYGMAALSAAALLARALGSAPGRAAAFLIGGVIWAFTAAQSAWVLRPYIGDPGDTDPPLFAHGRVEGGVLGALGRDLGAR